MMFISKAGNGEDRDAVEEYLSPFIAERQSRKLVLTSR